MNIIYTPLSDDKFFDYTRNSVYIDLSIEDDAQSCVKESLRFKKDFKLKIDLGVSQKKYTKNAKRNFNNNFQFAKIQTKLYVMFLNLE